MAIETKIGWIRVEMQKLKIGGQRAGILKIVLYTNSTPQRWVLGAVAPNIRNFVDFGFF